jgi:NAD-dependent SIR2 family protein deacetylase
MPAMDAVATPTAATATAADLRGWLQAHHRIFVLTGAGISTASGIPDYRGADGRWKRSPPITWQAFATEPVGRARYWARSFVGWPAVGRARPNRGHAALAALERQGRLSLLVTQNVDGLHERAGQRNVIDLHGRIDRVACLGCDAIQPRADLQRQLAAANPDWAGLSAATAPDGDADLEGLDFAAFSYPPCPACGGVLKPDVVFFGENVPRERVAAAQGALARSDAMLVVGSSLMVYSGYRFARAARESGLPLAILTRGVTRADDLATLRLDADCGEALAAAVDG